MFLLCVLVVFCASQKIYDDVDWLHDDVDFEAEKDVVWEAPEGYWAEESQLAELSGQSFSSGRLKGSLRTSWQFSKSPEQYFSLSLIPDSGGFSDISLGTSSFKVADNYGLLVETNRKDIYLAEIQPNLFVTVMETSNSEANLIGLSLLHRLGFMVTNSSNVGNITIRAIPEFFSKFKDAKFISLPEIYDVQVNLLHHHYRLIRYLIVFVVFVVTGVAVYIGCKIGCIKRMLVFVISLLVCTFIITTESRYFFATVLIFGVLIVIGAFALGIVFHNFTNEKK